MSRRDFVAAVSAAGLALSLTAPAYAGGPWAVYGGVPTKYPGAGTVTLNYDQGALGSRTKAQADALVTEAVSLWTNVATATVTLARGSDLPVDVTTANYLTYLGGANSSVNNDGLSPVVYDTDGSIIDIFFGAGAKSSVLGFAGSSWYAVGTYREYSEGRAVINGFVAVDDTTLKVVMAHEIGHMIGLDHTQLDNTQGLNSAFPSNYPLMYPIAYRDYVSLHEDEIAAVSALYPDVSVASVYGQLTGNFTQANGTPINGANLWVQETSTGKLYSIVSDYLKQNTGYFKLLLPPGTYTLHAEAIQTSFSGASSVGPYAKVYPTDASFQPPLYVGGVAMAPVTLGGGSPIPIVIVAGCSAAATFRFDGTGSVGGNCAAVPGVPTINSIAFGHGSATVSFTAPAGGGSNITGYTVTCTAAGQITRTKSGAASPITVGGLTGGVTYSCTVTASNSNGPGAPSAPVTGTPLAAIGMPPILIMWLMD
jgi:hypothetical protein